MTFISDLAARKETIVSIYIADRDRISLTWFDPNRAPLFQGTPLGSFIAAARSTCHEWHPNRAPGGHSPDTPGN